MSGSATRTVRGALADGRGAIAVETFALHAPRGREVLIEIKASGICHTDMDHAGQGRPLILGHEGAGFVAAVGERVTSVLPGDRVLLNWAIPCGQCFQCLRGAENLCENKPSVPNERFIHALAGLKPMFGLGTLAERALVPEQAVIRIPETLPFPIAAIMGCAVMTGYGSVFNVAKIAPNESVVVLGCGGVGLSVLLAAKAAGAAPIVAVDVTEAKLEQARRLGATHGVLAERDDQGLRAVARQVRSMTGGRGADYAFECTAVPELGVAPLAMVRNGGMAVAVSGIEQVIPADMELFEFDKWYINPLYGGCVPARDFPRLIALYQSGQLDLDQLIAEVYTLDQVDQAFRRLRAGGGSRSCCSSDVRRTVEEFLEQPRVFRTVELSDSRFERDGVRHITVKSPALKRRGDVSLYVPPEVATDGCDALLILLNGVYNSHWGWLFHAGVHLTARRLVDSGAARPLVLAFPSDGLWGDGSGYMAHGEEDAERWIMEDTVAAARLGAPGLTGTCQVFLGGLSMGGFGALRLGAKWAHAVAGISAHSAITNIAEMSLFVEEPLSEYRAAAMEELDPMFWIRKNKAELPPIRMDCGLDDPLLAGNRRFHQRLVDEGIPHRYEEFHGGHEWSYWEEHVEKTLLFCEEKRV